MKLNRPPSAGCAPGCLDRFTRYSADLHVILADLKAKGVTVRFLDNPAMNLDTAHGELLLAILAATAAFERHLVLTRTAEGREIAKQKGVKFGRPAVVSKELKARIASLSFVSRGFLGGKPVGHLGENQLPIKNLILGPGQAAPHHRKPSSLHC